MAKVSKNKSGLSEQEILDEIKSLSEAAKDISGKQSSLFEGVNLGDEDIDTGFNSSNLNDTANPQESHRLYYTMMMALRNNLPQGKKNEKLRRYVYDEKSLFLNRGKEKDDKGIRGSDERQTYIPNFLKVAYEVVYKWVASGADPFDIYMEFKKLNEKMGYRKDESGELNNFNETLIKILKVPPPQKDKEE